MAQSTKKRKSFFRRFFNFRGLAFRSGCFFFIGVFLILFVSFTYIVVYAAKMMMDEAKKQAASTTNLTISRIVTVLQPIEEVTNSLVSSISPEKPEYSSVLRLSKDYVITSPVIFGSCLAFEPYSYSKDRYYYALYCYETLKGIKMKFLGSESYNYFKQPWYSLPKDLRKPIWSDPYFDLGGGNTQMCTYSVPFYLGQDKNQQKFKGVLTMDVSLASLEKIVSGVQVFQSGFAMLISRGGKILTSPKQEFVNQDLRELTKTMHENDGIANEIKVNTKKPVEINVNTEEIGINTDSLAERIIRGETGFANAGKQLQKYNGDLIYYAPVGKTGWSLIVVFSSDELLSGLIDFVKKLGSVVLGSMIAALLITIIIVKRFTKPIRKLADAARLIGQGDFHAALPVIRSKNEIGQLAHSFALMQEELQNYIRNLQETTGAKEKIESELKVAHEIQVGMLPTHFPDRRDCDLFAILEPAKAVGGDLYDFFVIDKDHLYFAVGDVSGKGVPASLFMAITRTLFRAKAISGVALEEVFQSINNELCKDNPNVMFVTFQAAILDLNDGSLEICNAGHNPPILLRKDHAAEKVLCKSNIPLGINDQIRFKSEHYKLGHGDMLVLYSDGITEAINMKYELYREDKFLKSISTFLNLPAKETATRLIMDVKSFSGEAEQSDDITLLVVKYSNESAFQSIVPDRLNLKIKNQIPEIKKIAESIDILSEKWSIPPKVTMEINLALEELVTNIIFYAFDDKSVHEIDINFSLGNKALSIEVIDDGKPFNLLEKSVRNEINKTLEQRNVGGLGIHFIKTMMNHIEYKRLGEKNRVQLIKNF
jgi:phosphoserine phosphatase RsbU/P